MSSHNDEQLKERLKKYQATSAINIDDTQPSQTNESAVTETSETVKPELTLDEVSETPTEVVEDTSIDVDSLIDTDVNVSAETEQKNQDDQAERIIQTVPHPKKVALEENIDIDREESEQVFLSLTQQEQLTKLMESLEGDDEESILPSMLNRFGQKDVGYYISCIGSSINHLINNAGLDDSVIRNGSQWVQGILKEDTSGDVVGINRPDIKLNKAVSSARDAMIYLRGQMNMGDFISVPLPHTGIWAIIEITGESNIVTLQTRIATEKAVIGRRTNGMVFANTNTILSNHVADFLLGNIRNTSVGKLSVTQLKNMILEPDLQILAWAYTYGRFINGYDFTAVCTANPASCNHTQTDKVDLSKMLWIDHSRLTKFQLAHIRKRANSSHTVENVAAYQGMHDWVTKTSKKIGDNVIISLKVPTLDLKNKAGRAWIDDMETQAVAMFNNSLSGDARESYIHRQASISNLCQYAHWIESITIGDRGTPITNQAEILKLLTELSQGSLKDAVSVAIKEFINESTIGIVGYPSWECPSCNARQPATNKMFPAFVPINAVEVFFTLTSNAIQSIISKANI